MRIQCDNGECVYYVKGGGEGAYFENDPSTIAKRSEYLNLIGACIPLTGPRRTQSLVCLKLLEVHMSTHLDTFQRLLYFEPFSCSGCLREHLHAQHAKLNLVPISETNAGRGDRKACAEFATQEEG